MRIGIIGSSKFDHIDKDLLSKVIKIILDKGHELVLVPEKVSLPLFIGEEYVKLGGKEFISIIPLDDTEFGNSWVERVGKIVNCGTWRNQPEKLNEECDVLLSIGYCTGGIIEICYSKWFKKKPVYILNEFVSGKLPSELEKDLDLHYLGIEELEKVLS